MLFLADRFHQSVFSLFIYHFMSISHPFQKTLAVLLSPYVQQCPPQQPVLSAEAGPIGMGVLEESAFASFCSFSGAQMLI